MHLDQKSAVMARDTKIEKGLPTKLQILKPMKNDRLKNTHRRI
jgi:hypothetical protein